MSEIDAGREWDKPYLPPPWSAVQNEESGLWEVVCDGYDDETPVVCAGTADWPLTEADATILAASLDALEALGELLSACERDFGVPDTDDRDDEAVGAGDCGDMAITFGMLRRARRVLDAALPKGG